MSMESLAQFTKGELLKLVTNEWIGRVTVAVIEAVTESFEYDQVIRPVKTQDEIQRRFEITIRWFVRLRRELLWSVPRILDSLPTALRHSLDGIPFDPDEHRAAWHGEESVDLEEVSDIDGDDLETELEEVIGAVEAEDYLG